LAGEFTLKTGLALEVPSSKRETAGREEDSSCAEGDLARRLFRENSYFPSDGRLKSQPSFNLPNLESMMVWANLGDAGRAVADGRSPELFQ
jgi:hypothetical protein